jgi:hypothetical protein
MYFLALEYAQISLVLQQHTITTKQFLKLNKLHTNEHFVFNVS